MIKLTKLDKPAILTEREEEWTEEFRRFKAKDKNVPAAAETRYRHEEIKTTLRRETFKKCAYCESKILHVAPGQIDHILPSSERPDLVVKWENLTLVCEECNRRKGAYYDVAEPLIHPYDDDPADHLLFFGPLVLNAPGDMKGWLTRQKLELSRGELFERKEERLEAVQSMIDRWTAQPEGSTKELLRRQIELEASSEMEFSATVRAYLEQMLGWTM